MIILKERHYPTKEEKEAGMYNTRFTNPVVLTEHDEVFVSYGIDEAGDFYVETIIKRNSPNETV